MKYRIRTDGKRFWVEVYLGFFSWMRQEALGFNFEFLENAKRAVTTYQKWDRERKEYRNRKIRTVYKT